MKRKRKRKCWPRKFLISNIITLSFILSKKKWFSHIEFLFCKHESGIFWWCLFIENWEFNFMPGQLDSSIIHFSSKKNFNATCKKNVCDFFATKQSSYYNFHYSRCCFGIHKRILNPQKDFLFSSDCCQNFPPPFISPWKMTSLECALCICHTLAAKSPPTK